MRMDHEPYRTVFLAVVLLVSNILFHFVFTLYLRFGDSLYLQTNSTAMDMHMPPPPLCQCIYNRIKSSCLLGCPHLCGLLKMHQWDPHCMDIWGRISLEIPPRSSPPWNWLWNTPPNKFISYIPWWKFAMAGLASHCIRNLQPATATSTQTAFSLSIPLDPLCTARLYVVAESALIPLTRMHTLGI